MARVKLVALKPTFSHKVGAQFEAPEGYAKVLVKLGVARRLEAEEVAALPESARKKRTYKRRDLTAENGE